MTASRPDDARYREVHRQMASGEWMAAERIVTTLLTEDESDARAHFLRGRIALDRQSSAAALPSFRRAVEIDPEVAEYHAFLGYCHAATGDAAAASRAVAAAAPLPADERTLDLLATVHAGQNRYREAADLLQRAADRGSASPAIHFNLATALKFCGDFAGARAAIERAIALDPDHIKSRAALSALRPATTADNQIADYEALLARTRDPAARLHLCHAAARECHAIGDFDRAFALLEDGKRGMRRAIGADFAPDQALFDALRHGFAAAGPATGFTGARPIFVVGMPRSGTTVVDRILSGHPAVTSVGESLEIGNLLQALAGRRSPQLLDPRDVAPLLARADLSDVGASYVERTAGGETRRVVDKFHLNSLLAGFILRALPDARILCVVRGAMDTVVGNYRQLFEYRSGLYRYAMSAETIARFYVEFRRLAAFWEARFPDRFRVVSYEALVAEPERVGRAMFDFCDIDWQPDVLRIEDNAAPTATASAVQVREPLNARSIGSWRAYERHFAAARAIIERAGLEP